MTNTLNKEKIQDKLKNIFSLKHIIFSIFLLISFFLPLLLLNILFKNNNFYPFIKEGNTPFMIDAISEYISYFRYYKHILEDGGSFIYTTSKLFGGDFMSIFTFYLSSPFNLLIVFFSYEEIPTFFITILFLKICFTSLNMFLLLYFIKGKVDLVQILLSISYAFISYNFIYLSNIMWMDGVMILPLVILGLDFIFKKKAYFLYPLSLAYGLYSSWYIGTFICIFCIFYTIYKLVDLNANNKDLPKKERRKLIRSYLFLFLFLSLLGGGISSLNWVVAFSHLGGTKASVLSSVFPIKFYSISNIFSGFLENTFSYPNNIKQYYDYSSMSTGVISLVLFQLYFFNSKTKLSSRLATLFIFIFYILSLYISPLYIIMHGGKLPTWFPSRFSFIIGFITCYFAYIGYINLSSIKIYAYIVPIIMFVITYVVLKNFPVYINQNAKENYYYNFSSYGIYAYFITFSILFIFSLLILISKYKNNILMINIKNKLINLNPYIVFTISLVLLPLGTISSYRQVNNTLASANNSNEFQNIQTYLKADSYQTYYDSIKEYDPSFYRMENTYLEPNNYNTIDNEPMFYYYSGLSHYSSSERNDVRSYFSDKLGFQYNGFFEKYDGGSTVSMNSYLGIKYLVDKPSYNSTNRPVFMYNDNDLLSKVDELNKNEEVGLVTYKNNTYLPLAYQTLNNGTFINQGNKNTETANTDDIYWFDHFEYQNQIYKSMTDSIIDENGNKKDIFKKLEYSYPENYTFSNSNMKNTIKEDTFRTKNGKTDAFTIDLPKYSSVSITFTVPQQAYNQNLYFAMKNPNGDLSYSIDYRSYEIGTFWHSGIRSFKDTSNHEHILTISNNSNNDIKDYYLLAELYYEDSSVLKEYTSKINEGGIYDLKTSNSTSSYTFQGKINITNNNRDLVFTIPYEKNLSCYIDNKKVKLDTRFDIFTGVKLNDLSLGEHQIKLIYTDKAFKGSIFIVAFSYLGLVSFYFFYCYNGKEKLLKFKEYCKNKKIG